MSSALRERGVLEPATRPELSLVPRSRRLPGPKAILAGIYVLAVAYHWLNSRGHVTPVVFGDELLYSKLAQSLSAGDGFTFRGEPVFFPSLLPVLAQAPAWFLDSTATAFAVVKALNAAIMAAAVFPVYALARSVVRRPFAIIVAAAAVAGPPMLYHAYLMSEALAYPVFFLACATMVRAIDRPSRVMELAVVGVSLAACLTRVQFIVLPLAYLLAAPLAARLAGEPFRAALKRHRISLSLLGFLVALPSLTGGAVIGSYMSALFLTYTPLEVLRWSGFTAVLLAFAAGWLVVPGALFGLVGLVGRPRDRAGAAAGILLVTLIVGVLLEAGLIAAGEAGRAMERYAIYLIPLLFVAFFAYVERGAPHRRAYVALALVLGCSAWLVAFPVRAGTLFTFDTPTFSVYGQLASWWGHPNATTIFAGVPLLGGLALALIRLRGHRGPLAVGLAGICLLFLSGIPAYAGDRALTRGTLELRAGSPPDWLDRSGLGRADYLQLPGSSAHYGWLLETWNRSIGRPLHLGQRSYDGYASSTARIDRDGRLLVDGRPPDAGVLVLNNYVTQLELEGTVVARPRAGLVAVRHPAAPRVRGLAEGLMFDGWASALMRYRAWPGGGAGVYRVRIELPRGYDARRVTLAVEGGAIRTVTVRPATPQIVELPASGRPPAPLRIETDHANQIGAGTPNARLVAVRIPDLSYRTKP